MNEKQIPHSEYPRPQLRRDSYLCLNGEWELLSAESDEKIIVPYPRESALSGVSEQGKKGKSFCCRKNFALPEGFMRDRVLLNFGAVDQKAEVYLNGAYLGAHRGGYLGFSFDITEYLKEQNELEVRIFDDPADITEPYGKQREKRGGMWYTTISGIWQTVWLESVPSEYIRSIKIDMLQNGARITACGVSEGVVSVEGEGEFSLENGVCEITLQNPVCWSPENPHLYNFTLRAGEDEIKSYFAVRTLEIKKVDGVPRLCLNGKPYFFNGLLDQGYFHDGIFTPKTLDEYERDVSLAKRLGFNMLRKHIKIEPERFYYECDKQGIAVFQDMVNNGDYSFLRDTALPTVGKKRKNDTRAHKNKTARENFLCDMDATVAQLYNHPSICLWTIFNEGWGQFASTEAYHRLKQLDSSRFIDSASGWFTGGESDVVSEHVYFKPYKFKAAEKPVILSEFGGYAHRVEGHYFNEKQYGYKIFKDREELEQAILRLYREQVLPNVERGLCATVYTQLSDVEDETNGLITYDREVEKVSAEKLSELFKA